MLRVGGNNQPGMRSMLTKELLLTIEDSCREAGITIRSLFLAARLDPSTFFKWKDNPEKAKPQSLRRLRAGADHIASAMTTLGDALDARAGERE